MKYEIIWGIKRWITRDCLHVWAQSTHPKKNSVSMTTIPDDMTSSPSCIPKVTARSNENRNLLNKHYWNEGTLTGQNPSSKCCLPLEFLNSFKRVWIFHCWNFGGCRLKGCKATSHQTLRTIWPRVISNPGRLVQMGPGPHGRLFLETSNFDSW